MDKTTDDFDQTQAIVLDDEEDDVTDDLAPDEEKRPVAYLKVLFQKGQKETTYPLYDGDNVIGRSLDTCHVCISSKSLSKEHACIQILGDVHLLFDKGSRNKTRRGKLILSPDVRYELKDEDEITFADVKCVYQIADMNVDTVAETGSETDGSESLLLKHDVTGEDTLAQNVTSDVVMSRKAQSDEQFMNSDVIVKDTPEADKMKRISFGKVCLQTMVLTDSESEGEDAAGDKQKQEKIQETLLCEDSDPEASRNEDVFGAATQAYISNDVDSDTDEELLKSDLIGVVTQAYIGLEPTQALVQPDPSSKQKSASSHLAGAPMAYKSAEAEESTQVFDGVENEDKKITHNDSAGSSVRPTQVFEEDEDDENVDATGLFAVSTMACNLSDEDESSFEDNNTVDVQESTNDFDSDTSIKKNKPKEDVTTTTETVILQSETAVITSIQKNKPEEDVNTTIETVTIQSEADLISAAKDGHHCSKIKRPADVPTLVADETVAIHDLISPREAQKDCSNLPTQVLDQTVPVNMSEAKKVVIKRRRNLKCNAGDTDGLTAQTHTKTPGKGTQSLKISFSSTIADDDENGHCDTNKQPYTGLDKSTHLVAGENDEPIQVYCNVSDKPTQAYSAANDDPTQVYESDKPTQFYSAAYDEPTQVYESDKPTQIYSAANDEPTQVYESDKPTQIYSAANDEPTQVYESDKPTQVYSAANDEPTQMYESDKPAQVYSAANDEPTQMYESDKPTQVYSLFGDEMKSSETVQKSSPVVRKTGLYSEKSSCHDISGNSEGLQKNSEVYEEDTQANSVDDETTTMAGTEEPTQAYSPAGSNDGDSTQAFINLSGDNCEDKPWLQKMSASGVDSNVVGTEKPTQAYSLAGGNDADASQAFVDKSDDDSEDISWLQKISQADEACDVDSTVAGAEESTQTYSPAAADSLSDTEENVPDSLSECEDDKVKSALIPLPPMSPIKSVITDKRQSPPSVTKHVVFADQPLQTEDESQQVSPKRRSGRRRASGKGIEACDRAASPPQRLRKSQIRQVPKKTSKDASGIDADLRAEEFGTTVKTHEYLQGVETEAKGNNKILELGNDKPVTTASHRVSRRIGQTSEETVSVSTKFNGELKMPAEPSPATFARGNKSTTSEDINTAANGNIVTSSPNPRNKASQWEKAEENVCTQNQAEESNEAQIVHQHRSKRGRRSVGVKCEDRNCLKEQNVVSLAVTKRNQKSVVLKSEGKTQVDTAVTVVTSCSRSTRQSGRAGPSVSQKSEKISLEEKDVKNSKTDETTSQASSVTEADNMAEAEAKNESQRSQRSDGRDLRVSSRGRRISNNCYMKDFETGSKSSKQGNTFAKLNLEQTVDDKDIVVPESMQVFSERDKDNQICKQDKSGPRVHSQTVKTAQKPTRTGCIDQEVELEPHTSDLSALRKTEDSSVKTSGEVSRQQSENMVRKKRGRKASVSPESTSEIKQDIQSENTVRIKRGRKTVSPESASEIKQEDIQSENTVRIKRGRKTVSPESTSEIKQEDIQSENTVRIKRGRKTVSPESASEIKQDIQSENTVRIKRGRKTVSPESTSKIKQEDIQSENTVRIKRGRKTPLPEARSPSATKLKNLSPAKEKLLAESSDDGESTGTVGKCRKTRGQIMSETVTAKEHVNCQNSQTRKRNILQKENSPVVVSGSNSSQKSHVSTPDSEVSTPSVSAKHGVSPSLAKKSRIVSSLRTPARKSTSLKPRVMFTGVSDHHGEKIVKDLGGELATTIQDCTHLVTDKIRRTIKFLSGLAKGLPIVSPCWLESSKLAGTFLDSSKFLVSDPAMEKLYKFSLSASITKASNNPLLSGYRIHVSKSVKPDPSQMQDILLCSGAQYLKTMPSKFQDSTLVISCLGDQKLCSAAIKAGIPILDAEFILTSILKQELEFNAFALFTEDHPSLPAGKGPSRRKQ